MAKKDEIKKIDDDTKRRIRDLVKKEGLERTLKKLGIEEGIMKVKEEKKEEKAKEVMAKKHEIYQKIAEKAMEKAENLEEIEDIINLGIKIKISPEFYKELIRKRLGITAYPKGEFSELGEKLGIKAVFPQDKETYEKAIIEVSEKPWAKYGIENIVELAKEQGIKVEVPYEKIIKDRLEEGNVRGAEEIIDLAENQGVKVKLPKDKEVYEKGLRTSIEKALLYRAREIIDLAENQGVKVKLPKDKEVYEKGLRTSIENGDVSGAEEIIDLAKKQGVKVKLPPKEIFEKAVVENLRVRGIGGAEEIIDLAKKYKVKIDVPYEKNVIEKLKCGMLIDAEQIIELANQQGVKVELPRNEDFYKKVAIKISKNPKLVWTAQKTIEKNLIEFAKKQNVEVEIPKEIYRNLAINELSSVSEKFLLREHIQWIFKKFIKPHELKLKHELPIANAILVYHNPELGHASGMREGALEQAKKHGLTYEDIINIDLADYLDIPKEKTIDLVFEEKDYKIICKGILDEFDVTEGKYILGVDKDNKPTLIFDATLGEHKDIAFKYLIVPDGGGKMKIDKENKTIEVYGSSKAFGEADKEKTVDYLKKVFKDYKIESSREEE
jgi:type III secretion system FlhB-like substrate exporter